MYSKNRLSLLLILFFSISCLLPAKASIAEEAITPPDDVSPAGIDTYIYGYPLVTMEMTRRVMTNATAPAGKFAPVGQFAHLKEYPTATDKEVTAPNADTLYSLAWVNVAKEPFILTIPNAKGRYYLLPTLDGWTNVFADPGTRIAAAGTKIQKYAITGPHWLGQLPTDVKEYKSPTSLVWIIGRTYCTGTLEDYTKVHAFQDDLSLVPLSAYSDKNYIPPAGVIDADQDMKTPVRDQVNQMDAQTYFSCWRNC